MIVFYSFSFEWRVFHSKPVLCNVIPLSSGSQPFLVPSNFLTKNFGLRPYKGKLLLYETLGANKFQVLIGLPANCKDIQYLAAPLGPVHDNLVCQGTPFGNHHFRVTRLTMWVWLKTQNVYSIFSLKDLHLSSFFSESLSLQIIKNVNAISNDYGKVRVIWFEWFWNKFYLLFLLPTIKHLVSYCFPRPDIWSVGRKILFHSDTLRII